VSQERYDEKLIQILRSACGIFAERGFHNTSVRDVAAATGVSPAGLYYYFDSKEELLYLILAQCLRTLLEEVRERTDLTEDAEERLRRIVRAHLSFLARHTQEIRVLSREYEALSGRFRAEIRALMREYLVGIIRCLREMAPGAGQKELRAAAFGLVGMLTWVYQWYRPHRDPPVEQLAEGFAEIFLRGFLNGQAFPALAGATREAPGRSAGEASPSLLFGNGAW
jgi:AcrR family transcriptional regulator